jgi:DNA-binding XRE family transcriptional regulator
MKNIKKLEKKYFKDLLKEELKNPKFRREYEDLDAEFKIIEAIIDARVKHGLTQRDLAKKIGIPQSSLARFEKGKVIPGLRHLLKLLNSLNLKISFVPSEN